MTKHNAIIVLEALLEGIPVQIGTVLLEAGEDNTVGIRMTKTVIDGLTLCTPTPPEARPDSRRGSSEIILHVNTDLSYFIRKCEEMTNEEMFSVVSSLGLTE